MRSQNRIRQAGAMIAVVVAGVVWLALPAAAGIDGSVHDINTFGAITTPDTRICVACHTPHNANGAAGAPLWNHELTTSGFTMYSSATFEGSGTMGLAPTGTSLLCLSCHDGNIAVDAYGTGTRSPGLGSVFITGASTALVGNDLSNDHPISFTYDAALVTLDGDELNDPTANPVLDLLFGGQMECASCHDVHNGTAWDPLLRVDNTNSGLCTTCHIK